MPASVAASEKSGSVKSQKKAEPSKPQEEKSRDGQPQPMDYKKGQRKSNATVSSRKMQSSTGETELRAIQKARDKERRRRMKERRRKMADRQLSMLVFVAQKTDDPQLKAQKKSEKKTTKLLRYLKKYWTTSIDKEYDSIPIVYRTPDRLTHQKPENYWFEKRARQKIADHTGFFSSIREPYQDLGKPELETSLLVLQNLHKDLPVDTEKWFRDRAIKEDIMKKCDAPLERLPRSRVRKPHYFKGRVKRGAGGSEVIDKFVRIGNQLHNGIRGELTFEQLLERLQSPAASSAEASAFGVLAKRNSEPGDTENQDTEKKSFRPGTSETFDMEPSILGGGMDSVSDDSSRVALQDDRVHQLQLRNFEQIMTAIYHIIRSILNLRASHLQSPYTLPPSIVLQLRMTDPSDNQVKIHLRSIEKLFEKERQARNRYRRKAARAPTTNYDDEEATEDESEEYMSQSYATEYPEDGEMVPTSLEAAPGSNTDTEATVVLDAKQPMVANSSTEDSQEVARKDGSPKTTDMVQIAKQKYEARESKTKESAEDRCKTLKEDPEESLSRLKAAQKMYEKLFHGGVLLRPPIWQSGGARDGYTAEPLLTESRRPTEEKKMSDNEGGDLDAASISVLHLQSLDDIEIPQFKGLESPPMMTSEEHSQLNLIRANPEGAKEEPPSSPIRTLFELAGVRTTERDVLKILLRMKADFRNVEQSLRFYYINETEKAEYNTASRYRHKVAESKGQRVPGLNENLFQCWLSGLQPLPVYEKSIEMMRKALNYHIPTDIDETKPGNRAAEIDFQSSNPNLRKRTSLWYRKLMQYSEKIGADRHPGCTEALERLQTYCDVDVNARANMLSRFCLLVLSLPTTELGTRNWQSAVQFLLESLFGLPGTMLKNWLDYRKLPVLSKNEIN